jgi:putative transposase
MESIDAPGLIRDNLPQRRRKRQRLEAWTAPAQRLWSEGPNHAWALNFQFDQPADGAVLKMLNVVDEYARETLRMLVERRVDAGRAPSVCCSA